VLLAASGGGHTHKGEQIMGDRAIIYVRHGNDWAVAGVYTHWSGSFIKEILEEAAPVMRKGDPDYAMARLIGVIHNRLDGALSLGLVGYPTTKPPHSSTTYNTVEQWERWSPGDAGIFIVDTATGKVDTHGGYGFETPEDEGEEPVLEFYKH